MLFPVTVKGSYAIANVRHVIVGNRHIQWQHHHARKQPVGVRQYLVYRRRAEWQTASIVPAPYPLRWPELKGSPKVASQAPPLHLTAYRGDVRVPPQASGVHARERARRQ